MYRLSPQLRPIIADTESDYQSQSDYRSLLFSECSANLECCEKPISAALEGTMSFSKAVVRHVRVLLRRAHDGQRLWALLPAVKDTAQDTMKNPIAEHLHHVKMDDVVPARPMVIVNAVRSAGRVRGG